MSIRLGVRDSNGVGPNPNNYLVRPQHAPVVDTTWLKEMENNWRIGADSPNYLNEFLSRFDPTMYGLQSGAGNGLYGSPLLDLLTSKITGELNNPNAADAMGLIKDRMTGVSTTQNQQLNDRFAGWGRGSGVQAAQQQALNSLLAKNESEQYRQTGMDITNAAKQAALQLEAMKGGFYNNQQDRLNQNANVQGNLMGTLAEFLLGDAKLNSGNQQQSFSNLNSLYDLSNSVNQQNYQSDQEYQQRFQDWMRRFDTNNYARNNYGQDYPGYRTASPGAYSRGAY